MRYYIIIILAALSACETQPDCPTVDLPSGGTECIDVAFAELECHYHGEDRAKWSSMLDEVDYSTATVSGVCNTEITFDIEPRLQGRFDLSEITEHNPILAGLGFERITYCFGGAHCETSTHTRPYAIHPLTLVKLIELGADVSPWIAGGAL